jgi:hypothetical protein
MCIILVVPIRTFSHKVKIATRQSVLCYPIASAVPESTHYLVKRPESGAVQGAMGSFGRQGRFWQLACFNDGQLGVT